MHGHPIQLDQCFIAQAEEEGVRCGQQMANNQAVKVILYGAVVVGNRPSTRRSKVRSRSSAA